MFYKNNPFISSTHKKIFILFLCVLGIKFAFANDKTIYFQNMNTKNYETATFGNGCFWCSEAIFSRLKGIISVHSGYSGGNTKNPSYEEVCEGNTNHAEVVEIIFDPQIISYTELLEVFFKTHNPTTLNQQGADKGTQYRSVIFYHSQEQKTTAEHIITELNKEKIWENPIVTQIEPFSVFYKAENYHQGYFDNPNNKNRYCQMVILPKLEKFKTIFSKKLK